MIVTVGVGVGPPASSDINSLFRPPGSASSCQPLKVREGNRRQRRLPDLWGSRHQSAAIPPAVVSVSDARKLLDGIEQAMFQLCRAPGRPEVKADQRRLFEGQMERNRSACATLGRKGSNSYLFHGRTEGQMGKEPAKHERAQSPASRAPSIAPSFGLAASFCER